MTREEFVTMVEKHDLSFEYSDDYRVWRDGSSSLKKIKEAAKQFPREFVVKTWNNMCRKQSLQPNMWLINVESKWFDN